MTKIDWKGISQLISELHEEFGGCVVTLDADVPEPVDVDPVPITPDEDLHRVSGKLVMPKRIRGWFWQHRKADWMQERPEDLVFCSYYHEEEDASYVGAFRMRGEA